MMQLYPTNIETEYSSQKSYGFNKIISKHPEYEDMYQWYDGKYDPLAFDIQSINEAI